MPKRASERPRSKIMSIVGLMILVVLVLGVIVPLVMALTGSSRYEVNSEGVYVWKNDKWQRVDLGRSPWMPDVGPNYIIYFRNLNCPHCREFDQHWNEFLKRYGNEVNATLVQVVCTYFTLACSDLTAMATFEAFGVTLSPLIVVVSNYTILYYGAPPFNSTELYNLTTTLFTKYLEREQNSTEGLG